MSAQVGDRVIVTAPVVGLEGASSRHEPPLPGRIKSRYIGDETEFFVILDGWPDLAVGPLTDRQFEREGST